jgi:hypothetical protein
MNEWWYTTPTGCTGSIRVQYPPNVIGDGSGVGLDGLFGARNVGIQPAIANILNIDGTKQVKGPKVETGFTQNICADCRKHFLVRTGK